MASITLYNYFRSSTSYRVRIALYWKNLDFKYTPINLLKAEQRSESYLKINPVGGVPTLEQDGKFISESVAILEYLEECYPFNPLLPKDPYKRALIRQASEIINSFMHPLGNLKVTQYLEKKHGYNQEQKEEWFQHWAKQGLEALENLLKQHSGTYSFGNEVTLTDLHLIPQLLTCTRFKVDLAPYKTLNKINENCLKLEAFKKAHPFVQPDTPEELRVK